MVLAVGLWLRFGPDPPGSVGCWSVAILGLATVAVALAPMDCAVTADPVCRQAELAGQVSWTHQAHTGASVIAAVASLVGLGVLGWYLRAVRGWRLVGRFGLAILLPSTGLCLAMAIVGLGLTSPAWVSVLGGYLGVFQRVQLLLLATWIAALATALIHDGTHQGPPRPHHRASR